MVGVVVAIGVGVWIAVAVGVWIAVVVGVAVGVLVAVGVDMIRLGPNETAISRSIRDALGCMPDVVVWRNNTGKLQDRNGRWITYGLGVGGADLVGIVRMPGAHSSEGWGVFFALEIKIPGKAPTKEQLAWHAIVRKMGGFCAVVSSADEAMRAVVRCRAGLTE